MKRKSKQWFESYPETRCNTQQCKGKSLQKKLFYMKSSKVEYLGLIFSSYLSMTYIQLPANIRLDEDVLDSFIIENIVESANLIQMSK